MGKEAFTYQTTKDGVIRIFWENRCAMTLGGRRGQLLAAELTDASEEEAQYALQRVTGNFKRGNERRTKR